MDKNQLRKQIREHKRQFTSNQLGELSLNVITRLLSNEHVIKAKTILMYYSLPDEVNTHDVIDRLLSNGKTVLLPKVIDDERMEIRYYNGHDDMKEGAFHIMEPIGRLFTDYSSIDIAVIPGMSFDKEGNRLGRGKGYYDRFLMNIPDTYKIGVCFDFQKTEKVPTEENDVKMDIVI